MIFDTHAHYDSLSSGECEKIFERFSQKNVFGVLNLGLDLKTSENSIKLAESNDFVCAAVGLHPLEIKNGYADFFENFELLVKQPKVVAVGEIGLDYYHSPGNSEAQKEIFFKQVEFANDKKLPVCVHDREAHQDTLKILEELHPCGVVHCFSGDLKMAEKVLDLGMYLGIGFVLTFGNSAARVLEEVVKNVPLNKILIETDVPYMSLRKHCENYCDSSCLKFVVEKISEIKKLTVQEVYETTYENAKRLFRIA